GWGRSAGVVKIGGISVGGMSEPEARAALEAQFNSNLDNPIHLTANGKTFAVTPREAGASINSAATVKLAYDYGRSGSLWTRAQTWVRSAIHGHEVSAVVTIDQQALDAK